MTSEASHGTRSRYQYGCRCPKCRAASTAYQKAASARRKALPAKDKPHGLQGYTNYLCRCPVCVAAKADHARTLLARRIANPDAGPIPHGTVTGYSSWGCRCDPCKEARQDSQRPAVNAYSRKVRNRVMDKATRRGQPWTGPELEIADRRDLTLEQAALMLGRTMSAVVSMRRRLREEPKYARLAGLATDGGTSKSGLGRAGVN